MYVRDNLFYLFVIAIKKTIGETVGHLPMENSTVKKYLMEREARFAAVLTSSRYCVSSLVQGGLEILYEVGIYLHQPKKITSLSESAITLSNRKSWKLYDLFSFANVNRSIHATYRKQIEEKRRWRKKNLEKNRIDNQKDIRNFFSANFHLEETTVKEIDSQ